MINYLLHHIFVNSWRLNLKVMSENKNFEFVTALLLKLANSNYIEALAPIDKTISLSNSKDIIVEIRQTSNQAELTAKDELNEVVISIPLNSLISLLDRLGLLDNKLKAKLDFVFKQTTYMKKPEAIKLSIELTYFQETSLLNMQNHI